MRVKLLSSGSLPSRFRNVIWDAIESKEKRFHFILRTNVDGIDYVPKNLYPMWTLRFVKKQLITTEVYLKVDKVRIYLGHDNKTKKRFLKGDVMNFFNEYFSGYTIYETDGLYKGEMEESYVIEYLNLDGYLDEKFYKTLKKDGEEYFEQYSILVTMEQIEFI